MDPALADAATGLLTPDGPIGIMLGTTTLTNPTSVVTLDASHSPFFSMPNKVANAITTLG